MVESATTLRRIWPGEAVATKIPPFNSERLSDAIRAERGYANIGIDDADWQE
jgi:hypothetical protein